MRPVSLRIEGLRSFRAPVEIAFGDRERIAIVGDTGAGKSSILEAMTYALYGKTTFTGRDAELRNHQSETMRVVFRFRLGSETWEAVRTERRGRKNARLVRLDASGEELESVEQARTVEKRVTEILGLNADAFLRTVILPQGRFARLLVEDDPAARSRILRQVWRTDELEAAGVRTREALAAVKDAHARLETAAALHPEDPEAHLRSLQDQVEHARRRAEAAATDEKEAVEAGEALREAVSEGKTAAGVRGDLEAVDLQAVATAYQPLAGRAGEFREQDRELVAQRKKLDAQIQALGEVERAPVLLETLEERIGQAAKAAAEADVAAQAASRPLDESALESARQASARAKLDAQAAQQTLDAERRAASAAHAAGSLHAGDACPICARKLPAGWKAPVEAGPGDAEAAADKAQRAAGAAERKVVQQESALDARRKELATEVERTRRNAKERQAEARQALEALPAEFRPELEQESVRRMLEAARERKAEHDRLSRLSKQNERDREELETRRRDELDGALDRMKQELDEIRVVLIKCAHALDLDRDIKKADLESVQALDADRVAIAKVAQGRLKQAGKREEAARARFRELGDRLSAGSENPKTVGSLAKARADAARSEKLSAEKEAKTFAVIAPAVRKLRDLLDETGRKRDALDDLDAALKDGAFLKWLTLRRSRSLLAYASAKLREISGGRYAFVEPEGSEDKWRILDLDSGQPRTPASLSGGEQFLASLSLALGMVEMMKRTGGHIESFFLDEGFGSLDARNLDAAIEALHGATRSHMVAVISHVRAVAEQFDHVLSITREATGSRAEWLTPQQRGEIVAGDVRSSALASLLD